MARSATAGARSARNRATRHGWSVPQRRTRCSSAQTGRRAEARGRSTFDRSAPGSTTRWQRGRAASQAPAVPRRVQPRPPPRESLRITGDKPKPTDRGVEITAELSARRDRRGRQRAHNQRAARLDGSQPLPHDMPQPAHDTVADHRVADRLAHHEADLCRGNTDAEPGGLLGGNGMHNQPGTSGSTSLSGHLAKVLAAGQSGGSGEHATQADRRARPLRRRAARIALPARVRMRRRNPWVRARRRLFGWKVRLLTVGSPGYWLAKFVVPDRGPAPIRVRIARSIHPHLAGDLMRLRTRAGGPPSGFHLSTQGHRSATRRTRSYACDAAHLVA